MRIGPVFAAGTLLVVVLSAGIAAAQIDPANSFATMPAPGQIMVCPAGDGSTLASVSNVINIQVMDVTGLPMAGFVFSDFEVDGVPSAGLADGFNPPSTWDQPAVGFANLGGGAYQLTGTFIAGGVAPQAMVKVQGVILGSPPLPLIMNGPDRNADGVVNLTDIGFFAQVLGGAYDWRYDYNGDGTINLSDAGIMALHIGHNYPLGFAKDPVD